MAALTPGGRVREVRNALGLTLEGFGEPIKMKKNSLSQIENDKNTLTEKTAVSICKEFSVNYDYLLYGEGEMFSDLPKTIFEELCEQYHLCGLEANILKLYLDMPAEMRKGVLEYFKSKLQL